MKKIICFCIAVMFAVFIMPIYADADENVIGMVYDPSNYLTKSQRENVDRKATAEAEKTGLNIIIYICDNVGSDKSDYGVMDFADVTYDNMCGVDTDGILLLINLDNNYDYISTSGAAINYFSDERIDSMFGFFTDEIISGDLELACLGFISAVDYYYSAGKANNQTLFLGRYVDWGDFIAAFLFWGFVAVITGFVVFFANYERYKMKVPNTTQYMVDNSLKFNQRTDTYVTTLTKRVYSPRQSSGGSHGGGHSGHSSSHRSSSGGHHGGGGHHR